MWIARNYDNTLCIFSEKPEHNGRYWDTNSKIPITACFENSAIELDPDHFPEVTFENSPKELKIK